MWEKSIVYFLEKPHLSSIMAAEDSDPEHLTMEGMGP